MARIGDCPPVQANAARLRELPASHRSPRREASAARLSCLPAARWK
jgi:hypothetical protein